MLVKFPALCSAMVAVSLLSGCASHLVKPESMAVPAKLTCFLLPVPVESTEKRGLLDVVWNTRLERGPYVSAHEDSRGTYFRGPPGAVRVYQPELADKPPSVLTGMRYNGGIFVPRDGSQPVLYTYFSAQSMPAAAPPKGADCTNAVVVRDPGGEGISVTAYAVGGGVGGAAGGLVGRAASGGSNYSFGQSAGLGAVGGAIGMGLVALMVNLEVGKIGLMAPNTDVDFNVHLSAAANGVEPLKTN
jgi:hypothetical protein